MVVLHFVTVIGVGGGRQRWFQLLMNNSEVIELIFMSGTDDTVINMCEMPSAPL